MSLQGSRIWDGSGVLPKESYDEYAPQIEVEHMV